MFTWVFWQRALERALRAFLCGAAGGASGQYLLPNAPAEPGLLGVLCAAAYYGTVGVLVSLGLSAGATRVADPEDPSLLPPPANDDLNPPASSLPSENPRP